VAKNLAWIDVEVVLRGRKPGHAAPAHARWWQILLQKSVAGRREPCFTAQEAARQRGLIVTGTSPDEDGGASSDLLASPYRRRQLNSWFALTLYRRATTETDAPGSNVAATISRFSASGHRLFRRCSRLVSIIAFVDTSTSRVASDQCARLQEPGHHSKAVLTGGRRTCSDGLR
jgi:hypothetical protein